MKDKNLSVGILVNNDYSPSVLAGQYIKSVLRNIGIETMILTVNDVVKNDVRCDTIFNVYYGEIGDGGIISGLLEKRSIPFIGNTQYTCSLMMNKIISKLFFLQHGFLTPSFWYKPNEKKTKKELISEIETNLTYPFLAKSVNGAASENIHFINNGNDFSKFISRNKEFIDNGYYFFEQFIPGRELSVGYVDALDILLPVVEIKLLGEKYQSKKVKFSTGLKENIIPAQLPDDVHDRVQLIEQDLHTIFGCTSFSRTDLIYEEQSQRVYVLEINTNPGLLEKSLLPLMVKEAGVNDSELFLRLIEYSIRDRN